MREIKMDSIRSIDRAIDVLQAFSIQSPLLSMEEIAKKTDLPNSTVYRILYTLERRGLIKFNADTMKYKPGLRLIEFSSLVSSTLDIHQEAEKILIDLHIKTKQTVLMAVPDGDQIIYIFKRENEEGLKFASLVGQRRSFIYGVLGPVILAFLPDKISERILDMDYLQHTTKTPSDKELFKQRLQQIRMDKMYVEANETNIGVIGISAPVLDLNLNPIAAIGVIGPTVQLADDKLDDAKAALTNAIKEISLKMGFYRA